ncbi:hypothetical protein PCANC_11291 [Puccinia coronata f. sp. avenae]|uniref:DNA 3'-5' helicase n=1 Tax=Puccinia coronata f. sp. avenae TaxID=200324 RepID=A0A2N5V5B0_9BASI|nr:hypothetical protein PCANC_11291 [Puccinia coronata f. sp. avenae]
MACGGRLPAIALPANVLEMDDERLNQHITDSSVAFYHDQPKDLQVEAVLVLARGQNCFVRAGTGYGKTRISEMFFNMFHQKAVVLVLNPLDSLGDDQVREKALVNITAINLNKMTLNFETVQKIKKGCYSFIYLSPEVFLNSSLFTSMFFSSEFQKVLALMVVDEAHMIYLWGLVASRQSKTTASFDRIQDRAVFRPSYGCMATRLMATNNVPLLLLSATCRPIAVEAIRNNLWLLPEDLTIVNGELTRPEIRFIRITMQATLKSCDDLLRLYAPSTKVPAGKVVPTIIYSGTRNATFQVMKVVNEARHTKWHEYDPKDEFIRCYHSCTGEEDQAANMLDYSNDDFPLMSATMALGLGQNLKRVRCVVHMGRGDPSAIVQMVGRCGRDGSTGLGILFMEPKRALGKNAIEDFDEGPQGEDDRMDALAVTPVCLRIALTVDNQKGYIPLSEDANFLAEQEREIAARFPNCQCSNCNPEAAKAILDVAQQMTTDNFDQMLSSPLTIEKDPSITILVRNRKSRRGPATCNLSITAAGHLTNWLVTSFVKFYEDTFGSSSEFLPSDFFGIDMARAVVASLDQIGRDGTHNTRHLEMIIGGEFLPGQVKFLSNSIKDWYKSDYYQTVLDDQLAHEQFIIAEQARLQQEIEVESEDVQVLVSAMAAEDKRQKKEVLDEARKKKADKKAVEKALAASIKKRQADKAAKEKEIAANLKKQNALELARIKAAEKEIAAIGVRQKLAMAAKQKEADRASRAREKNEEREKNAARKADEAKKRKEIKDGNKRKALVNRQNMETQKARKLSTRMNTETVLAQYNNSLIDPSLQARQSLLAGLGPASEGAGESPRGDAC